MRVALVHDWLTGMRGGERCLEVIAELCDRPELHTLFAMPEKVTPALRDLNPQASVLNRLPGASSYYRQLLPLYPLAIGGITRKLATTRDLDLVISVSHCAAKNVRVPSGVPHISYCLTPMRYLWDQYDRYFAKHPLEPILRRIVTRLREWDVSGAAHVTQFVAISDFVRKRIERVYGRTAEVIYPPVRTEWIRPLTKYEPGEGFLVVNAHVPYKNTDVIIRAFNQLKLPLTVVGSGPDGNRLRAMAEPNVRFLSHVTDAELGELYRRARALVFAAEEDFGMAPVEMMAAGRPVIAFGRGGVLESVSVQLGSETGVFFSELSSDDIPQAIHHFIDRESEFTIDACIERSRMFSVQRFREQFSALVARIGSGQLDAGRESESSVRARAMG